MSDITLKDSHALIQGFAAKKKGPDDDRVLTAEIKLTLHVKHRAAAPLLGCSDTDLELAFWLPDEDRNKRFQDIEVIKLDKDIRVTGMIIRIGNVRVVGSLTKFEARPIAGMMMALTFTAVVDQPPTDLLPELAEYIDEQLPVEIIPEQQSLGFAAGGDA